MSQRAVSDDAWLEQWQVIESMSGRPTHEDKTGIDLNRDVFSNEVNQFRSFNCVRIIIIQ